MKRFLMTITLACVLSSTALAGDMPGVGAAPASSGTQTSAAVTVLLTILSLVVR
jgi:opacity protein-like surface antigen